MMRTNLFFALSIFLLLFTGPLQAQSGEWKVGFELGWSNSKTTGDLESSGGMDFESQEYNPGFHLYLYARRYYTDLFGIQFGLAYNQRGTKKEFEGPSYYKFGLQGDIQQTALVQRFQTLKTLNGYLDIPILAFHKIGERLEVGAGVYGGFLVVSKADGELRITERTAGGTPLDGFFITSDFNYLKDDFGQQVFGVQSVNVNGRTFEEPTTIGAYYEYDSDPGENLYGTFDYGVMAQIGFYFNESLNIKGRFFYGLADVTIEEADAARGELGPNQEVIFRDDIDRDLSMQISLGFLF